MKQNMKEAIGLSLKRYNDTYMKAANDRIDNIVSQAGTDNTEIVDARIDSAGVTHTTLNNRILAETKMNDQHLVSCSGEHITAENTMGGSITNLEVLGNTIQNEEDLADIKSVGELQEDGTYKMSILSCGKNLFNPLNKNIECSIGGSQNKVTYKVEGDKIIIKSNPSVSSDWGWVEFKNIKVTPNKSYTIHPNATVIKGNVCVFVFDSNNTKLFEIPNTSKTFIPTTKHITIRLYVQTTTSYTDAEIHYKPQLEEGTVATSYEPYQENKCDILLPCQLEKVGDVADRIICKDGVWGVEKNVITYHLKDFSQSNYGAFACRTILPKLGIAENNYTTIPFYSNLDYTHTNINSQWNDRSKNSIAVSKASIDSQYNYVCDITSENHVFTDMVKMIEDNDIWVKYALLEPQFIPLPRNTQIQLNSFFGTTHVYMESGEVEGIIKCKIPKSLGATVQSLNNKTDILSDRIEAIEGLKDSQNMKYETDKGYLVCKETKNGVIDDLKIEGKTLVNLINDIEKDIGLSVSTDAKYDFVRKLIPNTTYTLSYTIKDLVIGTSDGVILSINKSNSYGIKEWNVNANGNYITTITTPSSTENLQLWFFAKSNAEGFSGKVCDVILLEGDHTQNPPSYFEGLMSVGQDVDKIEVSSVKGDGNLWDGTYELGSLTTEEGVESNTGTNRKRSNFIPICGDHLYLRLSSYSDTSSQIIVHIYDTDYKLVSFIDGAKYKVINSNNVFEYTLPSNAKYLRFRTQDNATLNNDTIMISSKEIIEYTPHQSDKKQILFYNENGELEPIQELHEWDSIEKHSDNKWYYHKRSGKVVLNGSENWALGVESQFTETHMYFACSNYDKMLGKIVISDKFATNAVWDKLNRECIGVEASSKRLRIRILKPKLSTQDVEGFKQWLQTNNVTVVYQLAQEEVYELAPLHLDSYANETLILCNSGAISPKMEFSITSHINELVKAYGERINLLEEKVYKYMVTQNRMQLASTYSADSVTFKVDYFSLCGDEENYNEDLYNLILNNILVGKDNYDYDKMFTMILDYASWNQISWEQFDILVGLMDIQHNPPVEELPTEDVIEEDIIENEETPVE